MKQHPIIEGYMPYLGYQTYYRIVGEPSSKPALLLLHGGPGSTHNYFEVLDRIADTGRQVISYDQKAMLETYGQVVDFVDFDSLNPIIAAISDSKNQQVLIYGRQAMLS